MNDNHELLVLFCGPSGSGKTSIVHKMLEIFPQLQFSISATTRAKRKNEVEGRDYYFISLAAFKQKITDNEFLEWEEVYQNGYYGTLKSEVHRIAQLGKVVLFDVDVEGGLNIKKQFGENLLDIFVRPPSMDELRRRLIARATETDETLMTRVLRAETEITYANRFSHVIVNDRIEHAEQEATRLIRQFLFVKGVSGITV
ncbi:MAG: guanylate kinase [Bacteroidia bacterium]|nr:guanylate kinase [Bacteroidia bacterium]